MNKLLIRNTALLKLTYNEAIELLENIADELSEKYKSISNKYIDTDFTLLKTAGEGESNYRPGKDCKIKVGIKNLDEPFVNKFGNKTKYIRDGNFIAALDTLYHEFRHIECRYLSYNNCTISNEEKKYMNYNSIASSNEYYYDSNYLNMPIEIDACKYGMEKAHEYLKNEYLSPFHEQVILNYVNDRISRECERATGERPVLDRPDDGTEFKSIEEIKEMYLYQFRMCKQTRREYQIEHALNDNVAKLLNRKEWKDIANELLETSSPIEFDRKIACLELYMHPKRINEAPFLEEPDYRPEFVFTASFPEKKHIIDKVTSIFKKEDDFDR